jgi:gliding motility-associated-like protein
MSWNLNVAVKRIFVLIALFSFALANAQEICNNGIDDDGDGLVDINDPDCSCNNVSTVSSLFPNPSFEYHTACPSGYSQNDFPQLELAVPWVQATTATTDYFNTCGFVPLSIINAGLNNFPNGNGIVGAYYMKYYKEYIGTVLPSPLLAGVNYQLTFYISSVSMDVNGNDNINNSSMFEPADVTLYGSPNAANLPIDTEYSPDDPTDEYEDNSWVALGHVTYVPAEQWIQVTLLFTPAQNIQTVMLGPPLNLPDSYIYNYEGTPLAYFLYDGMQLNKSTLFAVNITQSGNFCEGNFLLTSHITNPAITGQTYQWYRNGIAIAGATQSTYSVPFDLANLAEFTVVVTAATSCYSSNTITATNSVPKPNITVVQPLCTPFGTITVNSATAAQYSFDGGLTWQNSATASLPAGDYFVKFRTVAGCLSETTYAKLVAPNLSPPPTGNATQTFCSIPASTIANLTATGTNILWYSTATGGTALPLTTPLSNDTTYYASQFTSGCESYNRFPVLVSLNSLPLNNVAEFVCDEDGPETVNLIACNSEVITPVSDYNFSYYTSLTGAQDADPASQITNPTSYLVTGNASVFVRVESLASSCVSVSQLNLSEVAPPVITISDHFIICPGGTILLNAGSGFDSYLWSTNQITQAITVSDPGNYSVTVAKNHGSAICTATKNITVAPPGIPVISGIETLDWTEHDNSITVHLSNPDEGDFEYSIDNIHFQDSNVFGSLATGEYTVYVRDKNNCGSVTQQIHLLYYPKFFTPNGDGFNDYWQVKFAYTEPDMKILIFDRYGKFLKELSPMDAGWDGTYNNRPLPSTDYWFNVLREDGRVLRGHFSMKR